MAGKRKIHEEEEEKLYGAPESMSGIREEEEKAGDGGPDPDKKGKPDFRMKRNAFFGALFFTFFLIVFLIAGTDKERNSDPDRRKEALETQDVPAETEIKTVLLTGPEERQEQISETEAPPETDGLSEEWQETIFGEEQKSLFSSIRVSGLSAAMKEKTGYRESDFLNVLSAFLQDNNLSGITEVTFEEEVSCSAPDSYAYRAGLKGREDKVLTVIFYPDYPGRYLLTLQDKQTVTVEVKTQPASESENTLQVQSQGPDQPETATNEQAQVYDATTLSVNGIPSTLLNYLENRYELQYTLYDYLYQQGRLGVTWAEVTGFEIDADAKTATISLLLSDSGSLTCIYDRTGNSYSYR